MSAAAGSSSSSRSLSQLGSYTLVAEIARGGMGIVYLAKAAGPANFHKLVVIKELKPELAEDDKFRDMFLDEAGLAARLNHRNIVQTIAVDQDGDRYFFVMEYLEGRTLSSVNRLKGDKALSVSTILRIGCDVLAGLHYAHELADYDGKPLGIVHRDVSLQNIFLTYDGQVKLLDFGVAKASNRDQQTETGELKGRVVCMAPEHVASGREVAPGSGPSSGNAIDRRADVFSVGVLLRELLTGKRVWEGMNEVEVLRELLAKRIPPLPKDAKIPDEARAVIEKAMSPEREDRYRTAHAMRAALEQYVIRIDPTGSLAKMGEHISREFAEHRALVRSTIDDHIVAALSKKNSSSAADLLPALLSSAPELPTVGAPSPKPSSSNPINAPSSSSSSSGNAIPPPPSSASLVESDRMIAASSVSSTKPALSASIAPPAASAKRGGGVFIAGGIAVVALAAVAAFVVVRRSGATTTTEAASSPASPSIAVAAAATTTMPEATTFELVVNVTPANAQVYVDDVLSQNPWRAKYARGSSHTIRAAAPGFLPKTEVVKIESRPATIAMTLDRDPTPPPSVASAAAARAPVVFAAGPRKALNNKAAPGREPVEPVAATPAPAAPPAAATPAPADVFGGGTAPKRTVDSKSPYE